jgi:outer membrane receptor for ferrienterochelin and colicin
MQPFQFFDFRGVADVCYFHQDYKEFIEFSFGGWSNNPVPAKRYGLRYLNIGPAKVNGIDFSLMGEGKITKHIKYTLSVSYTWSNPTTKDPDYVYFILQKDSLSPKISHSFNNTSSDSTRNVLKYRIEHMFKTDIEFTFFKKFSLGGTITYYSAMKNVDRFMFNNDKNNPTIEDSSIEV